MATDLTLVLSWSSQIVERMKTAAMITATFTHDPGNSEDAIRIGVRIRIGIGCNKKLSLLK